MHMSRHENTTLQGIERDTKDNVRPHYMDWKMMPNDGNKLMLSMLVTHTTKAYKPKCKATISSMPNMTKSVANRL